MAKLKILISFDLQRVFVEKIRKVSLDIDIVQSEDKKEALRLIADADILFAGYFSEQMFRTAKKLKWIQAWGAGVDNILIPQVVNSEVVVTSAGGIHPTPISEHVLGLMLCLTRKLHVLIRDQEKKKWQRFYSEAASDQIRELSGQTVGIVGLGKIGAEIARKSKCLGMRVIGTKRNVSRGSLSTIDKMFDPADLSQLLAESDFVVLSLPLTKETDGLIGEVQLKSMKRTGYLINISRGKIVQEDKLIEALKKRWIAGAALDTFETEPLPKKSELWNFENVIITPHVAGFTPYYMERLTNIFTENLKRFLKKRPLINVVNKTLGY
jgi:phosphoglycerate dehydrogenase-like enzyme